MQVNYRTLIQLWSPNNRPVHCSNCQNATVGGHPEDPQVTCQRGYGQPAPLMRMIRPHRPVGFREAKFCAGFKSAG